MAFSLFNDLPPELQIHICSYLEDSPKDLSSLALTSKACHNVAACYMFPSVRIALSSPRKLWEDVQLWLYRLALRSYGRHVRQLEVSFYACSPSEVEDIRLDFRNPQWWAPLGQLLEALPGLARLVVDHDANLSPQLVEALRNGLPRCRLNVRGVSLHPKFNSKYKQHQEGAESISAYDIALLSSPHLRHVSIMEYAEEAGMPTHANDLLAFMLASGLAPNLETVDMIPVSSKMRENRRRRFHGCDRSHLEEMVSWEIEHSSLLYKLAEVPKMASLKSLSLRGTSVQRLRMWSRTIDFTTLSRLRLGASDSHISWLAQNCQLLGLTGLDLQLMPPLPSDALLESFFDILPPLSSLSLGGYFTRVSLIHAIRTHGVSLRSLDIMLTVWPESSFRRERFEICTETVAEISPACPLLEDLAIDIAVDEHFQRNCIHIGRIRRLRNAHVRVSSYAEEEQSFQIWNIICGQRRGHLESLVVGKTYQIRKAGPGEAESISVQRIPYSRRKTINDMMPWPDATV